MKTIKIELTINGYSRISDDINLDLEDYQVELVRVMLKSLEELLKPIN